MNEIELSWILPAMLAAFIAGFVDAIAGGGGIITVPSLLFLGLSPQSAVATNKLVSTFGATSAAATFVRNRRYAPEVVRVAMPFAAIGALIGAACVTFAPTEFLRPLIAVVIIGLALYFGFRPKLGLTGDYDGLTPRKRNLAAGSSGAIGFYDGFLGPGTGAFFTFVMVRWLGFDFVNAAGNTKVLNWTSNIVALLWFLANGKVLFAVGLPMAGANLLGGYCGARFAVAKGSAWVRWIFIAMALLVAANQVRLMVAG